MRKSSISILLFAAVITLFGCKKESLNGDGISATIQCYDAGKVYLDNANYSVWHEGDQVLINTFQASVFDGGGNQWKVNLGENSVASGSMVYVLFPYNAAFSITGTTASLALPAQQTYAVDASGNQLINAPMAAKGTTELAFYNLCSLLKVQVPAGTYVKNIKVTTVEGNAPLAGEATVDYSGNVPVLTMASTGGHSVTLTVENSRADGIYYVCVPPVANKTFKVTANYRTTENGVNYFLAKTVWTNAPLSIAANQIGPVNMGEFNTDRAYLTGIFSVSSEKKVMFARANLSYGITWGNPYYHILHFNANQYYLGGFPYDVYGNTTYITQDYNTAGNNFSYLDIFSDWSDQHWTILSNTEWNYLMSYRAVSSHRYAYGSLNGIGGLILFPDVFTWPSGVSSQPRVFDAAASYDNASYTMDQWSLLEEAGCVFLPAGGYVPDSPQALRNTSSGYYWSINVTEAVPSDVYYLFFNENNSPAANEVLNWGSAMFVRLVYLVDAAAK